MSIKPITAQMILHEHLYKPITGTVVCLGRNSVSYTADKMDALLKQMGVPKRPDHTYKTDSETMGKGGGRITQESFFASFCDAKVISLDVNNYEGAEIVCDIQDRLPWRWRRSADFVYDGGSLDNIFDVATTLKNLSRLIKPGGRFLASNNGGPHPTSYLKFSADWFMDFFAINKYTDCKTYVCAHPNTFGQPHLGAKKPQKRISKNTIEIYNYNPYVTHSTGEGYDCSSIELQGRYQIMVLAEKGSWSTDTKNPIQKHYRVDPKVNRICNESARRFLKSPRPLLVGINPFDKNSLPCIDSSDYPEQITPTAVI